MEWFGANWQYIAFVVTAGISVATYATRRDDELRWKRTEFIFAQAQWLDSDQDLRRVLALLEKRTGTVTLEHAINGGQGLSVAEHEAWLTALDKFLNLFDRLYFAVNDAKTLQLEELRIFGWYLTLVLASPPLVKYCGDNGFKDVLKLARQIPADTAP